jgi:hypothetical protein
MADDPKPETPKPAEAPPAPDFPKLIAEAVKQHGNADAAFHAVLRDHYLLRDELAATKAKLPKDGHVVIDPDRAKTVAAYEALGDPAGLAKALEAGTAAAAERDELKFRSHVGKIAKLMNWDEDVLAERVKATGAEVLIKDEPDPKDPKKTVQVPHVKGEGDKTTKLAEHAAAAPQWSKYLASLSLEPPKPPSLHGSPPSHGHTPPRPPVTEKSNQPRRSFVS